MKRISILVILLLVPVFLRAQSVGEVGYGSEVFSTGIPENVENYWDPETGAHICMPKERREIALECIEWTFGKVESYEESYNECQGYHVFEVMIEGGLRVGRKPSMKCKERVVLRQNEQDPSRYEFWWEKSEVYGHFILDEDGRIKEIGCWFNAC